MQATRCVRLQNGYSVTKGENLCLQGGAGPKTTGEQSKEGDEKRVHRGEEYHLTNDSKP
jgi:hypothetical protein